MTHPLALASTIVLSIATNLYLVIELFCSREKVAWLAGLYESENMKFSFWQERAQSQERQHKESLNREMQYRLALDNVVNMNHGDPAYSVWVRQYAATILSRTRG